MWVSGQPGIHIVDYTEKDNCQTEGSVETALWSMSGNLPVALGSLRGVLWHEPRRSDARASAPVPAPGSLTGTGSIARHRVAVRLQPGSHPPQL